jgi:thiamine pyrophosphate-dependent acetolactate synthase large subunit-like protein
MEALRKAQDKIRFIHVRHEESAAFMACASSPVSLASVLLPRDLAAFIC